MNDWIEAVALGVLATAFTDGWALVQKHLFGIRVLDYRLLGRWLLAMRTGCFCHQTIMQSALQPGERALGWAAHYAIGVFFAAILLVFSRPPGLLACLLTGWITLITPFFLMQPAFGFGLAATKTPNPAIALRNSLLVHIV